MAEKITLNLELQDKFSNKNKGIKREIIAYFLIVCEGEKTEPNYFRGFPKQNGKIIYDITFDGGGISTIKVVEKAIELSRKSKQKYDRVWVVFDRDSFKASSFNSAIMKAKAHGIGCAWSNEAFELWYLLHFHNRTTPMVREEYKAAIENAINEKMKNKKKPFKYKKNSLNMFSILNKYGNKEQAISWAKKLNDNYDDEFFAKQNPATQVYKLVEELLGKSVELNKEIIEKFEKGE